MIRAVTLEIGNIRYEVCRDRGLHTHSARSCHCTLHPSERITCESKTRNMIIINQVTCATGLVLHDDSDHVDEFIVQT